MNFFSTRESAAMSARAKSRQALGGLVASVLIAATLTGCSAGQLSQTSTQEPAVNGASGGVEFQGPDQQRYGVALRDVRVLAGQTVDAGETVELLFAAANKSAAEKVTLVKIESDIGTVKLDPAKPEIPGGRSLIVGKPEGAEAEVLHDALDAVKATATVNLKQKIVNGLTYQFRFTFETAGQTHVVTLEDVPLTAGENAPRAEEPPSHGEGH